MPLKSTFLAFKKKWYKLPKLGGGGGEVIWAMPKRKHFFCRRCSLRAIAEKSEENKKLSWRWTFFQAVCGDTGADGDIDENVGRCRGCSGSPAGAWCRPPEMDDGDRLSWPDYHTRPMLEPHTHYHIKLKWFCLTVIISFSQLTLFPSWPPDSRIKLTPDTRCIIQLYTN